MCYLGSSTPLVIIDYVLLKGGHQTLSVRNDLSAVYCVHKGDAAIWQVCTNVDWKEAKNSLLPVLTMSQNPNFDWITGRAH